MLYHLPLETYKERYTWFMSAKNGWIENLWQKNGVQFDRIEGISLNDSDTIKTGLVLDFFNRSYYSLTQVANVIKMLQLGIIKNNDSLYFDDFWTPGIEAIAYSAQLAGIHLNIYAMLHAQTVDKYDFTCKLKHWMRHYEIGQSKYMTKIFVSSEYLMDLCTEAGIDNVCFGGHPYCSQSIKAQFPIVKAKENQIIFSSRFDEEKQPDFFIELATRMHGHYKFVMASSYSTLQCNNAEMKQHLIDAHNKGIIEIKVNLTKKEYYEELQKSKYQFNCAKQDWLSYTLLESITYGCIPIYPQYRSFPEYLPGNYLYKPNDINSAIKAIEINREFNPELNSIVDFFDHSVDRMLKIMKLV